LFFEENDIILFVLSSLYCKHLALAIVFPLIRQQRTLGMNAFTSFLKKIAVIKGTVSVISSDPSCKDDSARFTIVPLKHLYGQ